MNIRHLQHFVVLAETLHFGHAAQRLHITQPPLSRQIAALEQNLGVSLFTRHSRSVSLTPAGEHFLQHAQRLLADHEFALRSTQATARGERGEIRIGFTMCAAWSVLPGLLADFLRAWPQVSVQLSETLPRDLPDALQRGAVDVGLSFPMPLPEGLHYQPLFREALCAVLPADHPLAQGDGALSVSDLADEDFISFPATTSPELYDAVMGCCRAAGFQPRIRLETHLQQTIVNLVAQGLGVSLVPETMRRMRLDGAVFRPLQQPSGIEQGLFWSVHNPNPCLQTFIQRAGQTRQQPEATQEAHTP